MQLSHVRQVRSYSTPLLLVHAVSRASIDGMQATDKELVMMPNMWHVLTKEPGNEKIIARIIEWVQQRA
jgi:alpha-beta hydrolase superfamily lysophospholipase